MLHDNFENDNCTVNVMLVTVLQWLSWNLKFCISAFVSASDGVDLWHLRLDEEQLDSHVRYSGFQLSAKSSICICFGFAFLCSVMGCQDSHHFLIASKNQTQNRLSQVSCARCQMYVITSNCDWFTEMSASLVIGVRVIALLLVYNTQ